MFADIAANAIQKYLVTRDFESLTDAVKTIQAEIDEPSLLEPIIEVNMTMSQIADIVNQKPVLRLREGDYQKISFVLQADNFIRVKPTDADESTILLMFLASLKDNELILVPSTLMQ